MALTVSQLISACSLFVNRGGSIANDIRSQRSPLITEVWYSGDGDDSGPSMEVYLVEGATHADGAEVACEIVWPAIERGDPPEDFVFAIFAADRFDILALETTPCPEADWDGVAPQSSDTSRTLCEAGERTLRACRTDGGPVCRGRRPPVDPDRPS